MVPYVMGYGNWEGIDESMVVDFEHTETKRRKDDVTCGFKNMKVG